MYRLTSTVVLILIGFSILWSQSPHGEGFTINCASCHSAENWTYNVQNTTFNHDSTAFPLIGQHNDPDCRSCHTSLIFKDIKSDCIVCHHYIHQQTLVNDCGRCHTTVSWVVENITQLHEQISFPLMGAHSTVNCNACHQSETNLRFSPIHPECISCHKEDYESARNPDHIKQGFQLDCSLCHSQTASDWFSGEIVHSFFPLEQGHKITDCTMCHKNAEYSNINSACISCHSTDFANAKNPDHRLFPTECNLCHSLAIGWSPAAFSDHDSSFPIYSGKHKNEWDQCIDCHTKPGNFTSFSCIDCHEHNDSGDLSDEHDDVNGYSFDSNACYNCHPRGN